MRPRAAGLQLSPPQGLEAFLDSAGSPPWFLCTGRFPGEGLRGPGTTGDAGLPQAGPRFEVPLPPIHSFSKFTECLQNVPGLVLEAEHMLSD